MADRWQNSGGASPGDELLQGLEDLRRSLQRYTRGFGVWIALAALVLLWLASGIYRVETGWRGVVLLFGRVVDQTGPGLHFRLPWPIQSHDVVNVDKEREAQIGFRKRDDLGFRRGARGGVEIVQKEALMLTGDENIVDVQLAVQYKIQDPVKFLFGAVAPEGVLHSAAEVALRGVVGGNTIDYTMTEGRFEIAAQTQTALQQLLDDYQTGLIVTRTLLQAIDPPTEVRDAFHDVVRALEDRDRLVKEADGYREDVVPKARGEGEQEIQRAEAYKAQRVIRAQGDAERFLQVLAEYEKAKEVTRDRLYLESVERIMPHMEKFILDPSNSGGVVPLLPLKELGAVSGAETPEQEATSNQDGRK